MLPMLASNFWVQAILLPWPLNILDYRCVPLSQLPFLKQKKLKYGDVLKSVWGHHVRKCKVGQPKLLSKLVLLTEGYMFKHQQLLKSRRSIPGHVYETYMLCLIFLFILMCRPNWGPCTRSGSFWTMCFSREDSGSEWPQTTWHLT